MLMKKHSKYGEKSNVQFVNGILKVGPVRLNVYVFSTDGLLIDTGAPNLLSEFKPFFSEMDVDEVVLTHHHEDHSGGAAFLTDQYGLPIKMDQKLINTSERKAPYPFYRKLFWGKRAPFEAKPISMSFSTRTATWKAIETPGHAEDHLSFLNENAGQLFSGDLYVHPETKLILKDESIPQTIASIERVLTYDFEELFCCHAGYVKDGRKALQKKLAYLTELTDKVIYLHEKGHSKRDIQQQIFGKKYPITYLSLGEWDAKHIVHSILQTEVKEG